VTVRADKQVFTMNWLTPADVHVAEVHDFFTGIELPRYADPGFADQFEADKRIESEVISVGGSRVDPSRRLKSRVHPSGATGVARCVELFERLRGDACTQVDGARITLVHNAGGPSAVSPVRITQGPGANGE
jgi:acetyl-CoA C-acetyltransferase